MYALLIQQHHVNRIKKVIQKALQINFKFSEINNNHIYLQKKTPHKYTDNRINTIFAICATDDDESTCGVYNTQKMLYSPIYI